jgi:hypothetical protein
MFSYENLPLVVSKDSINSNPAQVGKAVYDILSRSQAPQEVGETIEAMTARYYEELMGSAANGKKQYDDPYYICILRKKEPWATNVLRQWYVLRQTRPTPKYLREQYPNHDHDVWQVAGSNINLQWTLPTAQDSRSIMKNRHLYDEQTITWIDAYNKGNLA